MIYYRELNLDRASQSRKNPRWLKQQWTRRHSRVVILRNDKSLMRWRDAEARVPEVIHLPRSQASDLIEQFEHLVFLGLDQQGPLFALDVSRHHEERLQPYLGESEFVDLREVAWRLDAQQAAQIAYARGLVFWNRHHRFCGVCGSPTRSENGGHMRRCMNEECGRMHFPRTDPAVIMLVEDTREPGSPKLLLGRGASWPEGRFSTLAGFVEPGESLEEAVAREVMEEAGVAVSKVRYLSSQPWPFPGSLMVGFIAEAVTREIRIDPRELAEAHWFTAAMVRDYLGIRRQSGPVDSISNWLLEYWLRENG